jgi:hypothetical protein
VRRPTIAAIIAIVLAGVVTTIAPGAAWAGPGKPTPTETTPFGYIAPAVKAKMLAQAPLAAAAGRISRAVERSAGYAGVGLDGSQVVVWWKGALPRAVRDVLNAERRSVQVRVAPAAHTRAELRAAAARIDTDLRANPKSPYYGIEIATDGSGIVVDADASMVHAAAGVPSRWSVPAGIPVSIKYGTRARTTGRLDDSPPYWGGGRIQNNDNNAFCTAGFAVHSGSSNYMLTAGHCGRPGGGWNNGNDSRFFGTGARENVGHDLLLISATVGGRIWDGGVGSGEFTKGVVGSDDAHPNEFLCTSGATAGAVCNFKVENNFQFSYCATDVYGHFECYNDLVLADQLNGKPGSRPGDSGGPVFSLSGSSNVIAKGTISGVTNGNVLIFQDFVTAQRDFGISVITG